MDEFEWVLATVAFAATTLNALTSGFKDIYYIKQCSKKQRRSRKEERSQIKYQNEVSTLLQLILYTSTQSYDKNA